MKEFTAKTFYTGSFYQRLSVVVTQLVIWMAIGSVDRAQSAQRTWNGSAPNWSETSAWQEGSVPGVDDEVMIIDPSTQSMRLDRDFTIDAFTLLPSTHLDDLSLNLGTHDLSITGSKGFFISSGDNNKRARLTISGAGSLVVHHPEGEFVHNNVTQGTSQGRLMMENLNRMEAKVLRFGIGDASLNERGFPQAMRTYTSLAKTNIIHASFKDDYTQTAYQTAIQFFRNAPYNNGQGFEAYLGQHNEFYADSFGTAMGRAGSDRNVIAFHPDFLGNDTLPVARFRNHDGSSPMSLLAIGVDANEESGIGSSNRGRLDLRGGEVDMQIDTILLAVNRPAQSANANASIRGRLLFDGGRIEAKKVRAGYQAHEGDSMCQGYLEVHGSGQLIVSEFIELGFATGDSAEGTGGYAAQGFGQINMEGGSISAQSIRIGSDITEDNRITMRDGARIEVHTQLASPERRLRTLDMNDSSLVLHVDANQSDPVVHVVDLLSGGSSNTLLLASIENLGSNFPVHIPLIGYESANPNFAVQLPNDLAGFIVNNTAAGTIDVTITGTGAAGTLTWTGSSNGDWDTSSLNWANAEGVATRFASGDFVAFNDEAQGSPEIYISQSVIPGQSPDQAGVTFDNTSKHYTLTGGDIQGTGRILKQGSGKLEVDLVSEAPLMIEEGEVHLTFNGATSQVTVGPEARFHSEGLITGLESEGSVTNDGEINGPVAILGGHFENLNRLNTSPASMRIAAGAQVTNQENGTMEIAGGDWELPTDATLINHGLISNLEGRLNVGGMLSGNGTVADDARTFGAGRLSINPGGTLSPGDGLGIFTMNGRFDLNPGGKLLIEVDLNHARKHDIMAVDAFGNIRGSIVMTNIGTKPFAIGQSFHVISNNFGIKNFPMNPNIDFKVEPFIPGPGLAWDISNLATNGILSIVEGSLPMEPPTLGLATTSDGKWAITWPETHLGWELKVQSQNLEKGFSNRAEDWIPVDETTGIFKWIMPIDRARRWEFFKLTLP